MDFVYKKTSISLSKTVRLILSQEEKESQHPTAPNSKPNSSDLDDMAAELVALQTLLEQQIKPNRPNHITINITALPFPELASKPHKPPTHPSLLLPPASTNHPPLSAPPSRASLYKSAGKLAYEKARSKKKQSLRCEDACSAQSHALLPPSPTNNLQNQKLAQKHAQSATSLKHLSAFSLQHIDKTLSGFKMRRLEKKPVHLLGG